MRRRGRRSMAGLSVLSGVALVLAFWLLLVSWGSVGFGASAVVAHGVLPQEERPGIFRAFERTSWLYAAQAITCSLEVTTTDKPPLNNHTLETAATIANYTEQALVVGNKDDLVPPFSDYYRLDNASPGTQYTVQAKPDWTTNYNLGIIVYDSAKVPIITDTNTFDNNYASVSFVADSYGPYFFKVFQISEQCTGHTYSLILSAVTPTSTATPTATPTPESPAPTPQPTWRSGFDPYEPNYTWELATTLAPGVSYVMNFVPWGGAEVDNDFLKIRVKPGLRLVCETSDLDPGVDPRIELYSGPGKQYFVTANDDISLGNFNSRISYYATFEGYVYLLVGQGNRMALEDTVNSDYTLTCTLTPAAGTTPSPPVSTPVDKGATPVPPEPSATPTLTPAAQATVLTFRLVRRPERAGVEPTPGGFRTFRVVVFYDQVNDGEMGAGEGVPGMFVWVLSSDGREELAQGYTDNQGQLSFTVPTVGSVRVVIPLLGVDRLVDASRPEIKIRILPVQLPNAIP